MSHLAHLAASRTSCLRSRPASDFTKPSLLNQARELLAGGVGCLLDLRIMRHLRLAAVDLLEFRRRLCRSLQRLLQFFLQLLTTTIHGLLPE